MKPNLDSEEDQGSTGRHDSYFVIWGFVLSLLVLFCIVSLDGKYEQLASASRRASIILSLRTFSPWPNLSLPTTQQTDP